MSRRAVLGFNGANYIKAVRNIVADVSDLPARKRWMELHCPQMISIHQLEFDVLALAYSTLNGFRFEPVFGYCGLSADVLAGSKSQCMRVLRGCRFPAPVVWHVSHWYDEVVKARAAGHDEEAGRVALEAMANARAGGYRHWFEVSSKRVAF